ncbi:polymer-forming cytoskeletal protein [bacterium]|nr:polymer-forming cytoskeletal protein [bacterium]
MFGNKSGENSTNASRDTQISNRILPGTTIEGNIRSGGDFRIDGIVVGSLNVGGKVVIGEKGKVEGDIVCAHASISGTVQGDVMVQEVLSLAASARIQGNMRTQRLVVESGAVFNGSCTMGPVQPPKTTEPHERAKTA